LQRIAVVVPPADWLNGILRAYHDIYRQALTDLGIATIAVPWQAIFLRDAGHIADLLSDLRAFRPQAAMSLSVGAWLMAYRLPPGRDGRSPNLFTDVLDIPSICLWDGAPLDFAAYVLDLAGLRSAEAAATSQPGALGVLGRELRHPRLIHWSRDSGQTRVMRDLGFLPEGKVLSELSPVLPGFAPDPDTPPVEDVAFIGHLNHDPRPWPDPSLATLAREIVDESLSDLDRPIWDILSSRTACRPDLDPDRTSFWSFAHRVIAFEAQAAHRRAIIGRTGATRIEGHLPLGPPLARAFARHAITVDVLNPVHIAGVSHKPMLGFASGGFVLLNRRPDFVAALGEEGEAVSYSSADELLAKIDLYLTKPALRREIGCSIRERLFARHGLKATLARVLEQAAGEVATRPAPPPVRPSVTVLDLLPRLRCWSRWPWHPDRVHRHGDGVVVSCHAGDWGYAARVALPAEVARLREPHLRVTLTVETGRLGIGLLRSPAPPILEQMVGPRRAPAEITLELPTDPTAEALIRKTSDEPARGRVTQLLLCDRP
jgi:hypothetical protein